MVVVADYHLEIETCELGLSSTSAMSDLWPSAKLNDSIKSSLPLSDVDVYSSSPP